MDKHYIGFITNQRRLEAFSSNQSTDEVLNESGYDFISTPFSTIQEAREEATRIALLCNLNCTTFRS